MANFESFTNGVLKNWVIIIAFVVGIYTMGKLNSEFLQEKSERVQLEERLGKKIKVIYGNNEEITALEKVIQYEIGYREGFDKGYNKALNDIKLIEKYSK